MAFTYILGFEVVLVVLVLFVLNTFFRSFKTPSLPPGPRALPLVGNIFDMPSEKEWLTFARWGETWGTLRFFYVLRRNNLFITRRYLFRHGPWPTTYYPEFRESSNRHARQEECHIF